MSADRPTQLVVLLHSDQDACVQLCHRLSAVRGQPFQMLWCESWEQFLALPDNARVRAVLASDEFIRTRPLIQPPVVHLARVPDIQMPPSGVVDSIWDQASASEVIRCLRYAVERFSMRSALERSASHDLLTGVCNRQMLHQLLKQAMLDATNKEQLLAVMIVDLDNFRRVNDTLGQTAGDHIICEVVQRLDNVLRGRGTIGRLGGDEFAIVIEDYSSPTSLTLMAQQIAGELAEPFTANSESLLLGCSVGVALYAGAGQTVDGLLLHANLAMQQAKAQVGCNFHLYDDRLNFQVNNRIEFEATLRQALRRNEFELHYQPRVELSSGKIVGLEGLIRWRHPERGLLAPGEFIPLAEETGLIVPMGYWIIARACHDLMRLKRRNFGRVHVAVNISFRQFLDSQLLSTVQRLLEKTKIDPHLLEFELTETAVMQHPQQVLKTMEGITGLGVRFSLDDFGTGFSSFVHLHSLPINLLKLDRSFVKGIGQREADKQLVKAMVDLGHSLGLEVVAEGVEQRQQLDALRKMGCDQIQGFFISPALAFDELCYFMDAYGMGRDEVMAD